MEVGVWPGSQPIVKWVAPPEDLPGFPDAKRARKRKTWFPGGLRKRWVDPQGNIYEWDYQHGTVEVYDSSGRHLGEFDPDTAKQTKEANRNRTVEP